MREPNEWLQRLADSYCDEAGLARPVRGHYVPLDTQRAERIAAEYERLPRILTYPDDIPVRAAYDALVRETRAQYLHLVTNGLRMERWTHAGQPYADSAAMCADLREHRHLYYYVGGEYHTYLGTANLLLRAVHDAFGHAAEGYQFGPRGEENAWVHHSMMFTPLAQRALTSETRGQNSWVNYGSSLVGAHQMLPPAERPYATQKCALLPAWCWDWRGALGASGRGQEWL